PHLAELRIRCCPHAPSHKRRELSSNRLDIQRSIRIANVPLDWYAVYPEYDTRGAAFDSIGYIGECFGETHIDYRALVNASPIAKSRSTLQLRNRRSLILPYFPAFPLT